MYQFRIILVLLATLAVTSCSSDRTTLDPIPDDGVILAFGDSLTYGTGVKPNESYPAVLQQLSGRKVFNAGNPGELSADGLKRLPGVLAEHSPNLLILVHGGNDMLRKKNLDMAANNLRTMILIAQERNIQVVMMAVPNPTLLLSPADFYKELADSMGIPIEVDAISDVLQYPANKSDTVHPNAKGYRIMAERIHALLVSHGAL